MNDKDLVKTNVHGLYKDKKTGVVINKDEGKYQTVLANRKRSQEYQLLRQEIELLKQQVKILMDKVGM